MSYLKAEDLKVGKRYHIKNNYADNLDELWWQNCKLIEIEDWHTIAKFYHFVKEDGTKVSIDGGYISQTSGEYKWERRFQVIESSIREEQEILKVFLDNQKHLND